MLNKVILKFPYQITNRVFCPQGPHSHILMTGGGGGPSDFLGSEILAISDIFGSKRDAAILGGCEERTKGCFWGMPKYVVIFLARQILKL